MPPKHRNRKCSLKDSKCGEGGAGKLRNVCKTKCGGDDLKIKVRNRCQHNIVNSLECVKRGCKATNLLHKAGRDVLIENISLFSLYKSISPFDRRITVIEWHPKYPEVLAAASKGGDILVWNYGTTVAQQLMIRGKGAGGSVQGVKFHPQKEMEMYTIAMDGTLCAWNYLHKTCKIFLQINDYSKWYTGLDVCFSGGHLVAGDNCGFLTVLSLDGRKMWEGRLHKNKITHAEYHPRETWLLTTASIDRTVKMWDMRFLKGRDSVLTVLNHDQAVNSAYFSLTDSSHLLTTDQHSQLRIYRAPLWQLQNIIPHPHRQFQHLTPIKATWHPLEDIVVVGRYPDEKFSGYVPGELRTIDFFDADMGTYKYGLSDQGIGGIISLNRFNILGDTLASAMGFNILIWQPDRTSDLKH
ncbi:DNA damage-binding protein 2-like [Cryptotermes secundus]|uniref:DNA damage-binding protein 2-like n=1 Tax=Cryptotermes secundus TaxID=105785 RepID=UPI000CD7B43A|nr:DNA damage-binding protein 2-like [Cryptotermes secundus]